MGWLLGTWATSAFRCYADVPKETGAWHQPVAKASRVMKHVTRASWAKRDNLPNVIIRNWTVAGFESVGDFGTLATYLRTMARSNPSSLEILRIDPFFAMKQSN